MRRLCKTSEEELGPYMPKMRVNQAINLALAEEMRADPTVMIMGEDIAAAGGPFKTSEGLLEEFGPLRSATPRSPRWASAGPPSARPPWGCEPVVEIMFVEFLGVALDMVVTEAAKLRYLAGG